MRVGVGSGALRPLLQLGAAELGVVCQCFDDARGHGRVGVVQEFQDARFAAGGDR